MIRAISEQIMKFIGRLANQKISDKLVKKMMVKCNNTFVSDIKFEKISDIDGKINRFKAYITTDITAQAMMTRPDEGGLKCEALGRNVTDLM